MEDRRFILVKFLEYDKDEVDEFEESRYEDNVFEVGWGEYAVYTDEEADEAALEALRRDVWNVSSWALAHNTGLPYLVFDTLSNMSEGSNDAVVEVVDKFGDWKELLNELDRGEILASYDGTENEFTYRNKTYYIYRRY